MERGGRNINYPIITHPRGGTDCRVLSRSCAGLVVYRCPVLVTPLAIVVRSQMARMNAISFVILAGGIIDSRLVERENCPAAGFRRVLLVRSSHDQSTITRG